MQNKKKRIKVKNSRVGVFKMNNTMACSHVWNCVWRKVEIQEREIYVLRIILELPCLRVACVNDWGQVVMEAEFVCS